MVLRGAAYEQHGRCCRRSFRTARMIRGVVLFTENLRAFYPLQVYSCVRSINSDAEFSRHKSMMNAKIETLVNTGIPTHEEAAACPIYNKSFQWRFNLTLR